DPVAHRGFDIPHDDANLTHRSKKPAHGDTLLNFDEWAAIFGERTERFLGGRGREKLVHVPFAFAFGWFLHLEQIHRMDLAPIFADAAGSETIVIRRHLLHLF